MLRQGSAYAPRSYHTLHHRNVYYMNRARAGISHTASSLPSRTV